MNIIDATKKAMQENMAITNPEDVSCGVAYLPTNSENLGFILVLFKENMPKRHGKYWQPTGADILREDWELC